MSTMGPKTIFKSERRRCMTTTKKSRYAITIPNFFRSLSDFGHHNHNAAERRTIHAARTDSLIAAGTTIRLSAPVLTSPVRSLAP